MAMYGRQLLLFALQKSPFYSGLKLKERVLVRRYGTTVVRNILKLHEREIFHSVFPEECTPDLATILATPQTVYCGFDPTAESLHIGNLLCIIALIHCQRAGHQPIAVIGGATAKIGDPSGKNEERPVIPVDVIEKNIKGLSENLERIFTNHAVYLWKDSRELKDAWIMNNASWYAQCNVIDFLTKIGRHFRMGRMLSRDSVQSRMSTKEGMSFTEFTYQLFQSYDWLYLHEKYNCFLQIGGNDQTGNILAGMELVHKAARKQVFGITIPLITTSQGMKYGKSEGNALWLDATKTTPYELYQYFMNTADADVGLHLKLFTFLPITDIDAILRNHKLEPEKRKAQKVLAEKILLLVHGEQGLIEAKRWTEAFFSDSPEPLLHLTDLDMQRLFKMAPTLDVPFQHDLTLLELIMKTGHFNKRDTAVKTIQAGGVYVNHVRVSNPDSLFTLGEHILPNNITLLRIGKKNYHIVRWLEL